uniref:Clionin n=1 Tax=Tritonia tetraquetra TaxID=2780533 RepID=I1SKI5_9GAST|nr:clionin precursor [Tritonia tetraquetra]
MSPFVCFASLATIAMFAILLPLTSATPLEPVIDPVIALEEMEAYHACLFICHNCFVEDKEKMMKCTNQVCGTLYEDKCALDQFIWLGHHCRHYNMIESMWSSKKRTHDVKDQFNLE